MARRALRAVNAAARLRNDPLRRTPPPSSLPSSGEGNDASGRIEYTVYIDWQNDRGETNRRPFYLRTNERMLGGEICEMAVSMAGNTEFPAPTSPPPPGYNDDGPDENWQPVGCTLGAVTAI